MTRTVTLLATAAAILLAPAAAQAGTGTVQFVGDPLTYLKVGQPTTQLTTAFRLNQPLPSGSTVTAQTSGGTVLSTVAPRVLGTSGLCYTAAFNLPGAVSPGGFLSIVLDPGGPQGPLAPNPEIIRLLTLKKQRAVAAIVGAGSC